MLQLVERGFFKFPPIRMNEMSSVSSPASIAHPDVQLLRVGKFNHPQYGEFEINAATLQEMKKNFDARVRGVDVAFDYFHDSDKEASGWPTELFLNEDNTELWAKVKWTPKAQQKLAEREIRYFSPDFAFQWKDPETGVTYKNVLFGGGLTNRPFVKDMAAIVASEQEKEDMKLEELVKLVEKQTEQLAAISAKFAEYADKPAPVVAAPAKAEDAADGGSDDAEEGDTVESLKKKLDEMTALNEKLMGEKKKLEESKLMAEKEAQFNLLLTEGKACVAQKDAFMKGDMAAYAKLFVPVNLSDKGTNSGTQENGDRADEIMKLAEQKRAANPKLSLIDAISLANKEIN